MRKFLLGFFLLIGLLFSSNAFSGTKDIGDITIVDGPSKCGVFTCYTLDVDCPDVVRSEMAKLKILEPETSIGTILLTTGGSGKEPYSNSGKYANAVLKGLRNKGYRTVQIVWDKGWLLGSEFALEGHDTLACRPATVADWVYENIHDQTTAFCASGNSGGASQISYMLTHYKMGDKFDAIVPTGGPVMSRMDHGCFADWSSPLSYEKMVQKYTIDKGFGFYRRSGPCANNDIRVSETLRKASIATRKLKHYDFPNTSVWLLFGENDVNSALGQGLYFYNRVLEAGTPRINFSIVPNTGHKIADTIEGAKKVYNTLVSECKIY